MTEFAWQARGQFSRYCSSFNFKAAISRRRSAHSQAATQPRALSKMASNPAPMRVLLTSPPTTLDGDTLARSKMRWMISPSACRDHQPTTAGSSTHRHAYSGLEGDQSRRMVRRQFPGLQKDKAMGGRLGQESIIPPSVGGQEADAVRRRLISPNLPYNVAGAG